MLRRLSTLAVASAMLVAGAAPAGAEGLSPREIYKKFGKAVVLVFATDGSAQGSAGTGSIITPDGQIITNAHVISKEGKPYKKVFVYLKPDKISGSMQEDLKKRFEAQIVEMDEKLDLALLKMKSPPADLQTIAFVDPADVEIGDPVVAIGHPETGGLWTLTTGSISSVVNDFQGIEGKHVFQTEASINRGNSGGPLLNAFGQMVGINTCISRRAADGLAITDINFSLKSSVPVEWMKKKDLLALTLEKTGAGMTAVASADPPKPAGKPEAKPVEAKPVKPKETYTVKGDDGETLVAVVEPEKKEEVAEDPSFNKPKATSNVSAEATLPGAKPGQKPTKPGGVKPPVNPPPPVEEPEAKQLTRRRPYNLEQFVDDRLAEMKALEKDMEDMRDMIEQRKGTTKGKKPSGAQNGMGLW